MRVTRCTRSLAGACDPRSTRSGAPTSTSIASHARRLRNATCNFCRALGSRGPLQQAACGTLPNVARNFCRTSARPVARARADLPASLRNRFLLKSTSDGIRADATTACSGTTALESLPQRAWNRFQMQARPNGSTRRSPASAGENRLARASSGGAHIVLRRRCRGGLTGYRAPRAGALRRPGGNRRARVARCRCGRSRSWWAWWAAGRRPTPSDPRPRSLERSRPSAR